MKRCDECEVFESYRKIQGTITSDNKEAFTPLSTEEINNFFGVQINSERNIDKASVKIGRRSYLLHNNDEVYFNRHYFKNIKKLRPGMHLSLINGRFSSSGEYPYFLVKRVFKKRKWIFWKEITGAILVYYNEKTK